MLFSLIQFHKQNCHAQQANRPGFEAAHMAARICPAASSLTRGKRTCQRTPLPVLHSTMPPILQGQGMHQLKSEPRSALIGRSSAVIPDRDLLYIAVGRAGNFDPARLLVRKRIFDGIDDEFIRDNAKRHASARVDLQVALALADDRELDGCRPDQSAMKSTCRS
jgi:hypothetical protein